jgi:hypothetical protein
VQSAGTGGDAAGLACFFLGEALRRGDVARSDVADHPSDLTACILRFNAPREFAGWQLGVKYASAAILVRSGAFLRKQCFDRWSRRVSLRAAGLLVQALYTRKSSEEGLEQEFNSLAAQREAFRWLRMKAAQGPCQDNGWLGSEVANTLTG